MDWIQAMVVIFSSGGVTLACFLYLASQINGLRRDMQEEARDFHGRLLSLEERFRREK